MPPGIVLGGGFAGLKAAVTLADSGVKVTLLEARPGLGGRARSFLDPATGESIDNGQHLFLSGYHKTLGFFQRLGSLEKLVFQKRLQVLFVEPGGKRARLACPDLPAPWHLLMGVWGLSNLTLSEKWAFRRVAREISQLRSKPIEELQELDHQTVEEWLTGLGQLPRSRAFFWYPLAIATLNESPSVASAKGLFSVLKVLMAGGPFDSRLGIACVGLSELYTEPARQIIEEKGGQVIVNSPVAELKVEDSRVKAVRLVNGSTLTCDWVISSLPPKSLWKILPEEVKKNDPALGNLNRFSSSPIVSVNLWLDSPVLDSIFGRGLPLFVGMIGTRFQWLFNKPAILGSVSYLSFILSAAHRFVEMSNEELVSIAWEDLISCFPKAKAFRILRSQVVREREATVSLGKGMESFRPSAATCLKNLFLPGDWTATGLPATIESAVESGLRAAQEVLKRFGSQAS